ncbi:MAG: hypothetical protein Q8L30_00300 [bacterium]|nr:hypothetical protein [bacterium]
MKKQIVHFAVDKEIDIKNHFIALQAYDKRRNRNFKQQKNERIEKLLALSPRLQKKEIERQIERFYKQKAKLQSLAGDINKEWGKIEKRVIRTLEAIHDGHKFPARGVRGVLSSADRFGYNLKDKWFAVSMFGNKYVAIDVALHELMHYMFHAYYENECKKKKLPQDVVWDIKESFTVLINSELNEFRFRPDSGYPPHQELRAFIKKTWKEKKHFGKTLEAVIFSLKKK